MHQALYQALPELLLPWYAGTARDLPWRHDREPYHVWLSEIMLQQTRVEAVKGYYNRFLTALPTIEQLANAEENLLLKLWEGLGYYNRVRNLQKAAQIITDEYGGRFPQRYADILALPGIGTYTAGAIASICFEQPTPAVDGNVLRVIARLTEDFAVIDTPQKKREITAALAAVYPAGHCGAFTQSLMELGAVVCVPNGVPNCAACPLESLCRAHKNGTEQLLPVRKEKKARRLEARTVFILTCGDKLAVRKRAPHGLLAGLWELPNQKGKLDERQAAASAAEWGVQPAALEKVLHRRHIFTHVEWQMTCYAFRCLHEADTFFWADADDLKQHIALPTAFQICLE